MVTTSVLIGAVLLVSPGVSVADDGPVIPRGKGDQCVADTDTMRRNHMDLIVHQRDETVIKGLRDEPFSLVECVECHAQTDVSGQPLRIDAEGQFCESCHAYAAVSIDCFSCHAAKPELPESASLLLPLSTPVAKAPDTNAPDTNAYEQFYSLPAAISMIQHPRRDLIAVIPVRGDAMAKSDHASEN
ncbi:hypothetical protein AB833_08685 [Chromatiales bacterium (ex Bugula neritina AB1)]|nr:hypothetical protein AB833_08685 [Chromatiales bacterium (ex Bugula neritina AB1)]